MSDILQHEDARAAIQRGINKSVEVVAVTAGPFGRNVVIAQGFGSSNITNDGATIVRAISLADPIEDIGAHNVKEVATLTEDACGDGTTTASMIFQSLVAGGIKKLAAGADPNQLKVGMSLAANKIVENLDKIALPVKDNNNTIKKVATLSANNDSDLGELIAEAFAEAGTTGEIAVSESGSYTTYLEVVEGLRFDRGIQHREFINNVRASRADVMDANILVTDKRIDSSMDLDPILKKLSQTTNNKLVIISDEISLDVLQTMAMAKMQGAINAICIKAPGFGDSRAEMLEDIAILTGATFIGASMDLRTIELKHLGMADKVYSSRDETTIFGGQGDDKIINERIDYVVGALKSPELDDDYAKEILQKRLSYLKGGVTVLYIGAGSDTELTEKKYRIEDAIGATQAAISEGVVPGGGIALLKATENLDDFNLARTDDEQMGINIVLEAVKKPFTQILENAGESPAIVHSKIIGKKNAFYGLNVKTGQFGDLMKLGVIDPVKVTKSALLNATSVAGLVLTTEAVIYDKKQ